ncbi:MAG: 4'-phosphopantetheinyl transferase superfamily protein [Pseudomonadota bacterium]
MALILSEVEARVDAFYDCPVSVVALDPRIPVPELMEGEAAAVADAVESRQQEFAVGRAAARKAMCRLGGEPLPIPSGEDRAPIWPDGWRGSIAHTRNICIAVVTRAPIFLGLDAEKAMGMEEDMIGTVCREAEIGMVTGRERRRRATLIFAAKEALFKAQFPITGELIGFDHVEIDLPTGGARFKARFRKETGPYPAGHKVEGRYQHIGDHVFAGIGLRREDVPEGE